MFKNGLIIGLATALGMLVISITGAMEFKVGDLTIREQTIRATVPTAKVAAGYLTIHNAGSEPDRLIGGNVEFAAMVEVHEMKMDDGVMKMRPLGDGLVIPAGGSVVLKPGAEHLMFTKLKEPMTEGEMRTVTLEFEKAGKVEVMFPVGSLGGSHSGHGSSSSTH